MNVRHILFTALLSVLATAVPAAAEHGSPNVTAVNDGGPMAPNDGIMLRGSNGISWSLGHLVQKSKGVRAYLKSDSERPIPVRIREAFDDMEGAQSDVSGGYQRPWFEPDEGYGESVVILSPTKPLTPGVTYSLAIRYPETVEQNSFGEWTVGSWTVTGVRDNAPPKWAEAPYVVFERAGDNDDTPLCDLPILTVPLVRGAVSEFIYLRLNLTPVGGGTKLQFLVPLSPDREDETPECLYRHMNLWNASAHDGTYYRVAIEAVDFAGNAAPAPGAPLLIEWNTENGISVRTPCKDAPIPESSEQPGYSASVPLQSRTTFLRFERTPLALTS